MFEENFLAKNPNECEVTTFPDFKKLHKNEWKNNNILKQQNCSSIAEIKINHE